MRQDWLFLYYNPKPLRIKQTRAWHRQHGVLVISGPNIKKDQRVYGASLLDIAPTVRWLLGRPVAKDMDGKALIQTRETEREEHADGEEPTGRTEPPRGVEGTAGVVAVEEIETYELERGGARCRAR